jgi:hypothetical protein
MTTPTTNRAGRRAAVGAPAPARPPRPLPDLRSPLWRAFMAGYEAGIGSGIPIGYRQAQADDAAAWARLRPLLRGITQRPSLAERRRRQDEMHARTPALTPGQIRARAYASWGLPDPSTATTTAATGQAA